MNNKKNPKQSQVPREVGKLDYSVKFPDFKGIKVSGANVTTGTKMCSRITIYNQNHPEDVKFSSLHSST